MKLMRNRTSVECPFCHGQLEREERPGLRKKAAYRCTSCDISLTRELAKLRINSCNTRKILATIEMEFSPRVGDQMAMANKLLENASITVSNELCEVKISNIKL